MTKTLIFLGLIFTAIPVSLSFLPIIPLIEGSTRAPKEFLALIFSMAIFLSALYRGELKPFKNKWLLIFLFFIPFAIQHSPPFAAMLGISNLGGLWMWKPFCKIIIYSLLIITVASLDFKREDIILIFKAVIWIAFLMALYVIVQKLNIDQFFTVYTRDMIGTPMEPKLIGTMGNSTLVSAFLVMCLPFCLYLRKWVKAGIIIIAVVLCKSNMATGAMIVSLISYLLIYYPKIRPYLGTLCVCAILILSFLVYKYPTKAKLYISEKASGRIEIWKNAIEDIKTAPITQDINTPGLTPKQKAYIAAHNEKNYPMTGIGLGSYKIISSDNHKKEVIKDGKLVGYKYNKWGNPHNEYLYLWYAIGIIGLGLYLTVIWTTMFPALLYIKFNPDILPIFISLLAVLMLSFGTFILQIEPPRIYAAILFGLLLNRKIVCYKN